MKKLLIYILPVVGIILSIGSTGCSSNTEVENSNAIEGLTPYTKDQVIFSLSLLSNINEGRFGSPDSLQAQAITGVNNVLTNDSIQELIGTWTPIWGPVTYTANSSTCDSDSCVSDNTMILLEGLDPDDTSSTMYVLAIAGTIGASAYDWIDEDFSVDGMVEWPAISSGTSNVGDFGSPDTITSSSVTNAGNYVSTGVNTGLNVLFNIMEDGSKGTIMEYLKDSIGGDSGTLEIAVAGHSLGGGLSPCVTLSLIDNQSYWNPSNNFEISCYATAGFSPGNANFANYFSSQIGDKFLGMYNSNDVVPHAFDSSTMIQIASLYDTFNDSSNQYLNNQCIISSMFDCANGEISKFNYTMLYSLSQSFDGDIFYDNAEIFALYQADTAYYYDSLSAIEQVAFATWVDLSTGCISLRDPQSVVADMYGRSLLFGEIALEEHFNAYINYYNIGTFNSIYSQQLANGTMSTSQVDSMIGLFENAPLFKGCIF